jgi:hypothetical protein
MDLVSIVVSVILFVAFVPGVLFKLPSRSSPAVVLLTHAVLFAVATSAVMTIYWSARERFGNFGPSCPNGFRMTENEGCVAVGHATYDPENLTEKTE